MTVLSEIESTLKAKLATADASLSVPVNSLLAEAKRLEAEVFEAVHAHKWFLLAGAFLGFILGRLV